MVEEDGGEIGGGTVLRRIGLLCCALRRDRLLLGVRLWRRLCRLGCVYVKFIKGMNSYT